MIHNTQKDRTMYEIVIDADTCKKDGLCAMTCPVAVLQQAEKATIPTIATDHLESCFGCGQCVSICPQGAISHSHYPEGTIHPVRTEYLPTYDQVLELVRTRRSKRAFKNKPVEREVLEKVLEVARLGPSGHNEQSTEFVVVQDEKLIHEIGTLTAAGLKRLAIPFKYGIGRMIMRWMMGARGAAYVGELAPEFEALASMYNKGTDIILHKPTVLLFFCADRVGGTFAGTNANIALHNAALAAETVGLGCFYAGFVATVSERDDSIARLIGLPDTHQIYGVLAMGYPRLRFRKWPERNPAKVTWIGVNGQ
jgi:nitroreductase/NAD-dependent dihydropyrimidine dehydrogenase PreA subunit